MGCKEQQQLRLEKISHTVAFDNFAKDLILLLHTRVTAGRRAYGVEENSQKLVVLLALTYRIFD